jgi:hypothetical protein
MSDHYVRSPDESGAGKKGSGAAGRKRIIGHLLFHLRIVIWETTDFMSVVLQTQPTHLNKRPPARSARRTGVKDNY